MKLYTVYALSDTRKKISTFLPRLAKLQWARALLLSVLLQAQRAMFVGMKAYHTLKLPF
jgi:hypothetical protein